MAPSNALPIYGNEKSMNLSNVILSNIQASPYFKHQLYELKTYHQVIDEIYYKVSHLEPWEKGSRKTAGQTGMCGGVRGVGAGGIVSSAYCLLYKLYTLKLTRKQLIGLCTHTDSPYIRALGLMYIRYTQPPHSFWDWYEPYLDDEEEVDPKAGGGNNMTIGEMSEQLLTKLDWYGSIFPRIPVPIQKDFEMKMRQHKEQRGRFDNNKQVRHVANEEEEEELPPNRRANEEPYFGEAERVSRMADRESTHKQLHRSPDRRAHEGPPTEATHRHRSRSRSRGRRSRSRETRKRSRDRRDESRSREKKRDSRKRSRSEDKRESHKRKKSSRHRSRSSDRNKKEKKHRRSPRRSPKVRRADKHDDDFQKDLKREMERVKRSKNGEEGEERRDCEK